MELRDLKYFAVIAECRNIGRAADVLELTPTALSKSLRRLEKSLGAKLVRRATKGVALTAVGVALLTRIGPLQGILTDVQREATDLAEGIAGHVSVGVTQGAAENVLADAWVALSRLDSNITFKATIAGTATLVNLLHKGEVDFCLCNPTSFSPTEVVDEAIYDDVHVVFASTHHRLAKQKEVSLKDLAGERWATTNSITRPQWQLLINAMRKAGMAPPHVALETNSQAVRIPAIAYSNYLGLSSRKYLQQMARRYPLVELPVKEMRYARRMSIIYRKHGYLSPATRRLITIIKAQAK